MSDISKPQALGPSGLSCLDSSELRSLGYSLRWDALFAAWMGERTGAHDGAGAAQAIGAGAAGADVRSSDIAPARVIRSDRGSSLVAAAGGVFRAQPSTALLKAVAGPAELPVAGDWVVVRAPADLDVPLIEAVLPRAGAITRGDPGDQAQIQVLAANIDTVFIVHPIDGEPNVRRIERELALAWDSGAVPVVVLTKADASAAPTAARDAVAAAAFGVDVLVTSAAAGRGVDALLVYVADHGTAVLIGPSGAGKSTLINALLGEERQATREVRVGDRRGRHTTVARELVTLPGGGLLIDTPGLRALALTGSDEGISTTFPDIEEAAQHCRFRDCTHTAEPGCAVLAAVESGGLPPDRLESYHKLRREAVVAAMKTDPLLRAAEVREWKIRYKSARQFDKRNGRQRT